MEKEHFINYEAPQVEIIEVEVEKGYTASANTNPLPDYEYVEGGFN